MQRKYIYILVLSVVINLCACQYGTPITATISPTSLPTAEPTSAETSPPETEAPFTGWTEVDGEVVYLNADIVHTGWLNLEDGIYYLDNHGHKAIGWTTLDGRIFYFHEDGRAAHGKLIIGEDIHYFSSHGELIPLVNRWNSLPIDYAPEIVEAVDGCWMDVTCADALRAMLSDLEAAVGIVGLLSGYRSYTQQYYTFYSSVDDMVQAGSNYDTAYNTVKNSVAPPGTSEHQLGLAIDVMNPDDLFYDNGATEAIQWLTAHCWDYGFILRYPEEKSHITGIIFEPWHYRYVGIEIAQEIKESGLCLEEYLDALTDDGTSCGNPDATNPQ